jgi:hypothetical protein
MRRQGSEPAAGMFRPQRPGDHAEIVRLVAIAARASCATPEALAAISDKLQSTLGGMTPPESLTAEQCLRLWRSFVQATERLQPGRWDLAGKALLEDLEQLGQQLDLMPLIGWERLPQGVDDGGQRGGAEAARGGAGGSVRAARKKLAEVPRTKGQRSARAAFRVMLELGERRRNDLLDKAADDGVLSRSETQMLSRLMTREQAPSEEDDAVLEAFYKLCNWAAS